jgi:hypothetical protein
MDLGPLAAIDDSDLAAAAPEAPPLVESVRETVVSNLDMATQQPVERCWEGHERRFGGDRRNAQAPLFGTPDKRVHVFGRRHTDRPAEH